MQAYAELIPPTAVTHAVALPFTTAFANNLVVAKTSLLQLFEVRSIRTSPTYAKTRQQNDDESSPKPTLLLVGEFPIAGSITSLAAVKLQNSKSGGSGLLVAVRDAKFSLVEWDAEVHGLSTTSIHYYEGEDLSGSPWAPALSHFSSYLTVDPSYRCAALKFGQRHLAILPFHNDADLDLDDFDAEMDGELDGAVQKPATDGDEAKPQTPYGASFVLQLTALDPDILHPLHLAFLHEYREPTLGVLYASRTPSTSIESDRKDALVFASFTLDIAQRARTPLQSIHGLPSDLFNLVPLALPIGGALLVGSNELVHIDQSGKVYALAVNMFAAEQSALPMSDQSGLALRLEGSVVQPIPAQPKSLLLVLNSGDIYILDFNMDGRTVSSISVVRASNGLSLGAALSSSCSVASNALFLGSSMADSILLHCSVEGRQLSRKRSHADMAGDDDEEESDENLEDEDDLYGDEAPLKRSMSASAGGGTGDVRLVCVDKLESLLPVGEPILAPYKRQKLSPSQDRDAASSELLQLVMPTGCGKSGGLSFLNQQVALEQGKRILDSSDIRAAWTLRTVHSEYDNIFVTTQSDEEQQTSTAYRISKSGDLTLFEGSDFEADAGTDFMGLLANGKRLVQITQSEIRTYDVDMKLSQLLAVEDEETEIELRVQHASFMDPYLLIIRNDKSIVLFKVDSDGELEELEKRDELAQKTWTSGSVHAWSVRGSDASLFLLSQRGALVIFSVSDLSSPVYTAEDMCQLPQILTQEPSFRRAANPEALTELLIADIGTSYHTSPYLLIRNEFGDCEAYEPFNSNGTEVEDLAPSTLRWNRKGCAVSNGIYGDTDDNPAAPNLGKLRALGDVNGYSTVFVPGVTPTLLLKEPSSNLRAIELSDSSVRDFCTFHSDSNPHGAALVSNSGTIRTARLPSSTTYGTTGWSLRRLPLGIEVEAVAYHTLTSLFVVATTSDVPMPDELYQHWSHEKQPPPILRPTVLRSTLDLLHPDVWQITDTYTFPNDCEHITTLRSMTLEISAATKARHTYIAVGTSIDRGEDLPCLGGLYLFDIVQVALDSSQPRPHTTSRKLKLIAHEEFRGAVTAITEAGSQGLLMAAQGQKILVRGLRDDLPGQLLPVAFLDVACYVSSLKNLKGTGLSVIADALKGVQLAGFEATPYRLIPLARSRTKLQVLACDFLPHEKSLFVVLADDESNIHVLEYNPDNPKSVKGERLILRGSVHTAHTPTSSLLLPCPSSLSGDTFDQETDDEMDTDELKTPQHVLLLPTASGSIIQITPLGEESYRRLSALQSHLSTVLSQNCAFNARAYRNVEMEGLGYWGAAMDVSGRGIVDFGVVGRWKELGVRGRREAWARVGGIEEVEVGKREVEGCRGGVLSGVL